jgi:hypothetical protein
MWALAMIDPAVYATPYIIAFIVCLMVFSALILGVSSLRNRRKRNIAVYAVMVLVLGLLAFQAHDVALGPTYVNYDFKFSKSAFYPDVVNQFNITSGSSGVRTANYFVVLNSVNASFTDSNAPDYIRVSNTTIKIPFSFNELKEASASKPVLFEISQNVTGFVVDVDFEPQEGSKIAVTSWTSMMTCSYNSTLNCYTIGPLFGAEA